MKITYAEIADRAQARGWYHEKILEEFRREVIKRVAGIQVRTMFNNKTYRVDDVDFRLSPGMILSSKIYFGILIFFCYFKSLRQVSSQNGFFVEL